MLYIVSILRPPSEYFAVVRHQSRLSQVVAVQIVTSTLYEEEETLYE